MDEVEMTDPMCSLSNVVTHITEDTPTKEHVDFRMHLVGVRRIEQDSSANSCNSRTGALWDR